MVKFEYNHVKGFTKAYTSNQDQSAQTPKWLLQFLATKFGKFFDPCPANPKFDGLKIQWKSLNYVNPPYIETGIWMKKALDENKESLMLIPFRPYTKYYEVIKNSRHVFYILKQSITFVGYSKPMGIVSLCLLHINPKIHLHKANIKHGYIWKFEDRNMENLVKYLKKDTKFIYITTPGNTTKYLDLKKKMVILCPCRVNQSDLNHNLWYKQVVPVFLHPIMKYDNMRLMCGSMALFVNFETSYFTNHKWLSYKINMCPLDFNDHVQRSKY